MKSVDAKSRYFCWKSSTSFPGSSLLLREGRKREDPGNEVEKSWVSLWAPTYTSFLLHSHTRGIFYYPFSFHSLLHLLLHLSLQFLLLTPVLRPSHAWLFYLGVSLIMCLLVCYVVTSLHHARLWYCRGFSCSVRYSPCSRWVSGYV